MASSRYLIGLDLGTTNSAVAYVDTADRLRGGRPAIRRFPVAQLVQPGETAPSDALPSFLYFPTEQERVDLRIQSGDAVVGVYAREHGALVPNRLVSSAKSWLCNPVVDRNAPILPWGHSEDEPGCSPVEASARYLSHIRDTWNGEHAAADERFERQTIVLTVPASFDEEARELTVQAARDAGLEHVTLLEEPLAAFYAWMASHAASFRRQLRSGDTILICDVGGGTTDFTLIRADFDRDEVRFERTAIGEHLLLGGDNLDLALARRLESKLGNLRLTLRQQQALARLTAAAKERLLGDDAPERATIGIPAAGRALVGGRLASELTRDEVVETLRDGFVPAVSRTDLPARATRAGLREFGLPYATEPAITRHLAAFLTRAAGGTTPPLRPDAVLFNGGFFTPAVAREAVVRAIESWFAPEDPDWHVKLLSNRNPATAVAVGAAHYAFVREHGGVRVSGGSARAYYIGLQEGQPGHSTTGLFRQADASDGGGVHETSSVEVRRQAVCVMPRGTEEGTTLDLAALPFTVAINRPIAFPLYSATVRHDGLGSIVALGEDEAHEHAPLVTILRYGKKSRQGEIPVHLAARFTEVGTLEIWCHSDASDHRWRLQFELRSTEHAVDEDQEGVATSDDASAVDGAAVVLGDELVEQAASLIREVFGPSASPPAPDAGPETLVTRLEALFGYARQAWPVAVIRRLADVLLDVADGRRKAPRFESRWLNLAGFCLRPGFGATLDEWRMEQMRRVYLAGPAFPKELQGQAEWFVLWQRVAGGLSAGQQHELLQRYRAPLGIGARKESKRINPQVEREGWRLVASLELLPPSARTALGKELLERLQRQPENAAFLWSLGRLGARIPSYGPINTCVPASAVAAWIDTLLSRAHLSGDAQAALVSMAARTGDPHRDVDDTLRERVIARLSSEGGSPAELARVRSYVAPAATDAIRMFGEALPVGLRLMERTGS